MATLQAAGMRPITKPLVSIIVPTYNHERYIGSCLQSISDQTISDWEAIVIDDGSTDSTQAIVSAFCETDSRIRYIHQENRGPWRLQENYNTALQVTRGKFIAVLEGDDFWPRYKLQYQIHRMHGTESVLDYGIAGMVDMGNSPFSAYLIPFPNSERFVKTADLLLDRASIQPTTILIRRDALDYIGGFRSHPAFPAVDLSTFLPLSQVGPVTYSNAVLGFWRQHPKQITATLPIITGAYQVALDFVCSLSDEEQRMIEVTIADVVRARQPALTADSWTRCLGATRTHSWQEACRYARRTIILGNGFRRLEGTLAFACASLHIDFSGVLAGTAGLVRKIRRSNDKEYSAQIDKLRLAQIAETPVFL